MPIIVAKDYNCRAKKKSGNGSLHGSLLNPTFRRGSAPIPCPPSIRFIEERRILINEPTRERFLPDNGAPSFSNVDVESLTSVEEREELFRLQQYLPAGSRIRPSNLNFKSHWHE